MSTRFLGRCPGLFYCWPFGPKTLLGLVMEVATRCALPGLGPETIGVPQGVAQGYSSAGPSGRKLLLDRCYWVPLRIGALKKETESRPMSQGDSDTYDHPSQRRDGDDAWGFLRVAYTHRNILIAVVVARRRITVFRAPRWPTKQSRLRMTACVVRVRRLLIRASIVLQPTALIAAAGIVVGPMDGAPFGLPFVDPVELDGVAFSN